MLKIPILLSTFYFLFSTAPAEAAVFKVETKAREVGVEQQFQADILINTEGEGINAVEGKVIFPDVLVAKEVRLANSLVSFWIEQPRAAGNEISFSGVIPSGYIGKDGNMLSIIFESKKEGAGTIGVKDGKALLNDGQGTEAKLSIASASFTVKEGLGGETPPDVSLDTLWPETFTPFIGRDPNTLDGKWFAVFSTQDKQSGIDHYEVKESRLGLWTKLLGGWERAESPYVLRDQNLESDFYVRAFDRAGHWREQRVGAENKNIIFAAVEIVLYIISAVILLLLIRWFIHFPL